MKICKSLLVSSISSVVMAANKYYVSLSANPSFEYDFKWGSEMHEELSSSGYRRRELYLRSEEVNAARICCSFFTEKTKNTKISKTGVCVILNYAVWGEEAYEKYLFHRIGHCFVLVEF